MIEIPAESHYTVYKLTAPNGLIYIGCTGEAVERRWHKGYPKGVPIRDAIDEFGLGAFKKDILCEHLTREGASKLEKWFIACYDSTDPEKGYNRMLGGLDKGVRMCEASKRKCSESTERAYAMDPTYRERVGEKSRQLWKDPARREQVSRFMREYLSHPENRAFAECDHRPKRVKCVETEEEYPSMHAAEKATGIQGIHQVCLGVRKTCGGYHWENC